MGELKAELVISTKKALQDIKKFRKEMDAIIGKKVDAPAFRRIKERGNIEVRTAKKTAQEKTKIVKKQETIQKSSDSRIATFRKNLREGSRKLEERHEKDRLRALDTDRKLEQRHEKARLRAIATEQSATTKAANIQKAAAQRRQNILSKRSSKQILGIFQVQQAIEDFSFAGFRGASNNIAFLASQFGGAGGLIALVGLAGASIFTMTRNLRKNSDAAKKNAAAHKKNVEELKKTLAIRLRLDKFRREERLGQRLKPFVSEEDIKAGRAEIRGLKTERDIRIDEKNLERSPTKKKKVISDILANIDEVEKAGKTLKSLLARNLLNRFNPPDAETIRIQKKSVINLGTVRRRLFAEAKKQGVRIHITDLVKIGRKDTLTEEADRFIRRSIQTKVMAVPKLRERETVLNKLVLQEQGSIDSLNVKIKEREERLAKNVRDRVGIVVLEKSEKRVEAARIREQGKGLAGFAEARFGLESERTKVNTNLEKERKLLEQRITEAAGDPKKIRKAEFESKVDVFSDQLERANNKLRDLDRIIKKRKGRGLFDAFGDVRKTRIDKEIAAINRRKSALQEEHEAGTISDQQAEKRLSVLSSELVVQLKLKDAAKEKANSAKKATQDAIRDAKRLDQQLASSKSGFASSLFGARLGFAAKVTSRQAENVKRRARLQGLGSGQDKNIDRFFKGVGLQRERGIVRGRLSQLTGEARAAGAAGNFQGQIGALKQRQQLEFQRSAQEQNLQTSFKFLQAAQKTQEEIERIFSRKGAGQIQMNAAQIQLQAAKMQLAAVGGAVGAAGGAAVAGVGGGGVAGAGGPVVAKRPRRKQFLTEDQKNQLRAEREKQRLDVVNAHKNNIMNVDRANEAKRGKAVEANAVRIRAADGAKRKRLQDIEQKRRFFENFNMNAASMLLTGLPPQGRFQPNVNQQNQNISNVDNSGQVGNIVNHFNGNMTQEEINTGIASSRQGATRGGLRRGRSSIREMQG